jgi:two-component sensor histidine kinase/HPt (histidine-containing phosphotransfer) domain-containing protein/HAMP domain-containing protein
MKQRSFRTVLVFIILCFAIVPAVMISLPLVRKIAIITQDAAETELSLQTKSISESLSHEIGLVTSQILTLGQNKDVIRASSSALFGGPARNAMAAFMSDNKLVSGIYLIDDSSMTMEAFPESISSVEPLGVYKSLNSFFLKDWDSKEANQVFISLEDKSYLGDFRKKLQETGNSLELPPGFVGSDQLLALAVPLLDARIDDTKSSVVRGALVAIIPFDKLANFALSTLDRNKEGLEFQLKGQPVFTFAEKSRKSEDLISKAAPFTVSNPKLGESIHYEIKLSESKSVRFASVREVSLQIAIGIGVASVIFGLISFGMARKLVAPIRPLTDLVNSYADGNYQCRLPSVSFLEFNRFISVLSSMANRILAQIKELQNKLEDIRQKSESLESIVAEGKLIGTQADFISLANQVAHSIGNMTNCKDGVLVYFHSKCFLASLVQEGFYLIDETGQPLLKSLVREIPYFKSEFCLPVKDPRTQEEIAFVRVPLTQGNQVEQPALFAIANTFASAINTVILVEAMQLIERKTKEVRTIFANINQGIFTIEGDFCISREYSAHLERILGSRDLAGKKVDELIFQNSDITMDTMSQIKTCIDNSLGEDVFNYDLNAHLMPRQMELKSIGSEDHSQIQNIELDWLPILNEDGAISRFMVTLRDVTSLKRLKEAAERNGRQMAIVEQIVTVESGKFSSFMEYSRRNLERISDAFFHKTSFTPQELHSIKRDLHTIKGNSRTFNLRFIADSLHEMETLITELDLSSALPLSQHSPLGQSLKNTFGLLDEYNFVNNEKLGRTKKEEGLNKDQFTSLKSHIKAILDQPEFSRQEIEKIYDSLSHKDHPTLEDIIKPIASSLAPLAKELGKREPKVELRNCGVHLSHAIAQKLEGLLMHLFRNSLDHGFGADDTGVIALDVVKQGNRFKIIYQDSGQGLNLTKLKEKGIANHRIGNGDSEQATAELIFDPGLSTASEVTQISGRGVGMDAVKAGVEELGGKVELVLGEQTSMMPLRKKFVLEFVFDESIFVA